MNTREAVAARIVELCWQHDITINGLATVSAVPSSTLKNIISGVSKNPGVVTLKKLCDGLNISLTDFFDAPIFQDLEQEIK